MAGPRILIVRISSMGDVIHALPAVAAIKHSFLSSHVAWVIDPRWTPLLEGNQTVDEIIPFNRRQWRELFHIRGRLRAGAFDAVVDFQGLVQSALVARAAGAGCIYGFDETEARERKATLLYTHRVATMAAHVVDKNLELAAAAGARHAFYGFPLPPGSPEGELPEGDFVLASPEGGWGSKQWPVDAYRELAGLLRKEAGLRLVVNGPPGAATLREIPEAQPHYSSIAGLIDATARAKAVVGIDSGPMHLAAAMRKPGVAIFGPTDPRRNGPYGDSFTVLRSDSAVTSYRHVSAAAPSMRVISARAVFDALMARLGRSAP